MSHPDLRSEISDALATAEYIVNLTHGLWMAAHRFENGPNRDAMMALCEIVSNRADEHWQDIGKLAEAVGLEGIQ